MSIIFGPLKSLLRSSTQGNRYHKLRKTFGKFFISYSELLSKFGDISFQEYMSIYNIIVIVNDKTHVLIYYEKIL